MSNIEFGLNPRDASSISRDEGDMELERRLIRLLSTAPSLHQKLSPDQSATLTLFLLGLVKVEHPTISNDMLFEYCVAISLGFDLGHNYVAKYGPLPDEVSLG